MTLMPGMRRRGLLGGLVALGGCSVLPDRPYQETLRFALAPPPPRTVPPNRRGPVLLLRTVRAAAGMEVRGLRVIGPQGEVTTEAWAEWVAPPADLAEEAMRRWLVASGRFAAVTAPGSRLPADLTLEAELTRLESEPAAGRARAGLAGLLIAGGGEAGRVLTQFTLTGEAPLPGGPAQRVTPGDAAAGMSAALADALRQLDVTLARAIPARR